MKERQKGSLMPLETRHADVPSPDVPGLELLQMIGQGGMSVVYLARHRNLDRQVAVKILDSQADSGANWLRESRLMAALAHPNVVTIHDAGQTNGHRYLVMEHMAGGSLRSRMTPGEAWPLAKAMPLLDSVASALSHIHSHGVLHLDLKPENILYTADGHVKISDFGLSVSHSDAHALLEGRQFHGTPDYCAPERRSGLSLDERFDVFSLATVTYELLTGRLPGRVYRPATKRNPRLPAALDAVLSRGLSRDPNLRHRSIAEFHEDLVRACNSGERKRNSRKTVLFGGLAVAIVLAALFVPPPNRPQTTPSAEATPKAASAGTAEATPQQSATPSDDALPATEDVGATDTVARAAVDDRPDKMWLIYDDADGLTLFAGLDEDGAISGSSQFERIRVESAARQQLEDVPLPVWPIPRPMLLVHSPQAWAFVYPFSDQTLAKSVLEQWQELLDGPVAPEQNLISAGDFTGDCLSPGHEGEFWRAGSTDNWTSELRVELAARPDQPDNQALLLTNMDTGSDGKSLIGCYQSLSQAPPSGSVVVLRFRACSTRARGGLGVYAALPVYLPHEDSSLAALRLRKDASPLKSASDGSEPTHWLFRCPSWIVPAKEWRTYLVVMEVPPFPSGGALHRNFVIHLAAMNPAATDRVWLDDVELFVWQSETN